MIQPFNVVPSHSMAFALSRHALAIPIAQASMA
jgi:hypothetical protein